MQYRKLRIAFSVGCVVVCLLLMALRVQSYTNSDSLELKISSRVLQLRSEGGRLELRHYSEAWHSQGTPYNSRSEVYDGRSRRPQGVLGFGWQNSGRITRVFAPYWFLILLSALFASFAALLEIHVTRRFSLRTLMLAMTLIALLLGAVSYLVR